MNLLQLNKFGELHNGKTIFFCKTEHLLAEFKIIKCIKNEVILISGNADEGVDDKLITRMPDNILIWYGQNILAYHNKLKPIPIGLENSFANKRKKHGVGWAHAIPKVELLNTLANNVENNVPSKFLYANFNIQTNLTHRLPIKELCIQSPFITWEEPLLNYDDFISKVLDHEAVICPAGNGIDTHRLYEILYCGRIPVTIKAGNYPIYTNLYEKLPVVILDTIDDLKDQERLKVLVGAAKQKKKNLELLDFGYWQRIITGAADNIAVKKTGIFKQLLNYWN